MYEKFLHSYIQNIEKCMTNIRGVAPYKNVRFQQLSYSKSTAIDILELLKTSTCHPITVVEKYAKKMDNCALEYSYSSMIYSVHYDTAMDILDNFITLSCV